MKAKSSLGKLKPLRNKIDLIDQQLVELVAKRLSTVKKISQVKKACQLPIIDREREKTIYARLEALAKKERVPSRLITDIFKLVIAHSRKLQKTTLDNYE